MACDELNRRLAELRLYFDVTADRIEKRFNLLAEGVTQVSGEVRKTRADLGEAVERTAAETQTMVRFSHPGLAHRVKTRGDGSKIA